MIKCNGCIHLPICSSREEKCQHYQSKSDIRREFAEKVKQMMKMPEYGFCNVERIKED